MQYIPDRWVLLEISNDGHVTHKVFGTWFGGYVDGESWRLNSGITRVHRTKNKGFAVEGYSGSEYQIRESNYGTTGYTGGVVEGFVAQSSAIRLLKEKEALEWLTAKAA